MQNFSSEEIKKLEQYLWVKEKPGKDEIILWEKVAAYSGYFSKIPGVLCICVGNSLAMNAAHKDSDIDLFIITKKNRIWTVRILMTLMLMLLRQRKTSTQHAWKFCLSFFITERALDFSTIKIKNDIYMHYWIKTLKPIINRDHSFENFLWVNLSASYKHEKSILPRNHTFLTKLWDVCEKVIQLFLLPKTKKSFQNLWKPFWVIISDDMLKFHDQDRRKEIRDSLVAKK